jgi:hypothetical protein
LWAALERLTRIAEAVTVERDRAAGWRLAGFLVAAGLIAGRAVAGDWQSTAATNYDFAMHIWPAMLLLGAALIVESLCRATAARPTPSVPRCGLMPSLVYLGGAGGWLWWKGLGV